MLLPSYASLSPSMLMHNHHHFFFPIITMMVKIRRCLFAALSPPARRWVPHQTGSNSKKRHSHHAPCNCVFWREGPRVTSCSAGSSALIRAPRSCCAPRPCTRLHPPQQRSSWDPGIQKTIIPPLEFFLETHPSL